MNLRLANRSKIIVVMIIIAIFFAFPFFVQAEERPKEGGIITLDSGRDPDSLDFHLQRDRGTRRVITYMYDPLIRIGQGGNFEPRLAESWDISDDGKVFTFNLRDDVTFHDGTQFDAYAAKYNVERILDPEFNSPHIDRWEPFIESVEVVDEFTFRFILDEVYAGFMDAIAAAAYMVSPEAAEELGDDFAENPVGTGPFKFEEYVTGSHVDFVRYEDYWDGTPYPEGLRVRIIPEYSTTLIELEAGNVDIVHSIRAGDQDRVRDAGANIEVRETPNYRTLYFNLAKEPTNELSVRKAISHAIDRKAVVEQVIYGMAEVSRAGVPEASPFYTEEVPMVEYGVEKANEILEEAGWNMEDDGMRYKDGEPLEIEFITYDAEQRVLYTTIFQEQLREIGIDAEIQALEWGAYLEAARAGDFHATYWQASGESHLTNFDPANLHSREHWNVSQIVDQSELDDVSGEIDKLIEEAEGTVNLEEQIGPVQEVQKIVYDNQLVAFLWHDQHIVGIQPEIKDYKLFDYILFWLEDAWINK